MAALLIPNFAFEEAGRRQTLPRRLLRLEAELSVALAAVGGRGDAILCDCNGFREFWEQVCERTGSEIVPLTHEEAATFSFDRLTPWGWTEEVRRLAERFRIPVTAPPQPVIWQANSRQFAYELARNRDLLLPGERCVTSLAEVRDAIQTLSQGNGQSAGWILKANLGQSGRSQIRGREPDLTDSMAAQIERFLQSGQPVFLEPQLQSISEQGWQWDLPVSGEPVCLGITELRTDAQGSWRESAVVINSPGRNSWNPIDSVTWQIHQQALRELQTLGYHGPVGIDVMQYQTPNGPRIRPLQDINARWTMGRIALAWAERVHATNPSGNAPCGRLRSSELAPSGTGWIAITPEMLDGCPVQHRLWWNPNREKTA